MSDFTLEVPDYEVPKELAHSMYDWLLRTRLFEDEIYYICSNQTAHNPFICGKGYLSTGQEAISVGCALAIESDDWFAQSHRDMGVHLQRGLSFLEALYQYRCSSKSPTQGKDGNVHFAKAGTNMVGFTSHMGQNVAVACGIAWAQKYNGTKNVVMATYGDGAAQQGIIHESMNYAATFKLPQIFVINHNRWAISVPSSEQMATEDLYIRGSGYEMPAIKIDGNNCVDVYRAARAAVERAREGLGPSLIECKSMRIMGHGSHDPATYVPQEEKDHWAQRDPIDNMKDYLMEAGWLSEAEDAEWRKKIKAEIDAAVDEAGEDGPPLPEWSTQGAYSESLPVE